MAKQSGKKSRKDKKKDRNILVMSLLVVVTMLFSGLYFFGQGDSASGGNSVPSQEVPYRGYTMLSLVANSSIYVQVAEVMPEIIAIPSNPCVSAQEISWVYNISLPGLSSISLEVANPARNVYNDLCGNFFFFRFTLDDLSAEKTGRLQGELDNRLGSHLLRRAYVGVLPFNMSGPGTDRITVLGSLDIEAGDIAEILVFQRSDDGSVFALERAKIPFGPTVPAKVVGLTEVVARGTADMDIDLRGLKIERIEYSAPVFSVNETLGNETLDLISSLEGVSASLPDNRTEVRFNASGANVSLLLEERNVSYQFSNGSLILRMPLNTTTEEAMEALNGTGVKSIEVYKMGYVEVPQSVIIDNRIVGIENYGNLTSLVGMDAKAGDRINVTLSSLSFGDQVFVIAARQEI